MSVRGRLREFELGLLLSLLIDILAQGTVFSIEDLGQLLNLLEVERGVHVLEPGDAAYLFGEARRAVGAHCNQTSLGPFEVRCSNVHRVEPEGEIKHGGVPHMTLCIFAPSSNQRLLLLRGRKRAIKESLHVSKRRLKA